MDVLSALLPEDFFFPIGGLHKTFLFLESSEVLGAFNLSSKDTIGVTGLGSDCRSDSEDESDSEDSAELVQTIELEAILHRSQDSGLRLNVTTAAHCSQCSVLSQLLQHAIIVIRIMYCGMWHVLLSI